MVTVDWDATDLDATGAELDVKCLVCMRGEVKSVCRQVIAIQQLVWHI
jgi:hypothetical protein